MHDQNFKNLILDYPVQALEFFAGEEAGSDLSEARIIPVRQEQLKERLEDRFRELDTPLLVEWSDGRREAILFVVEEETKTRFPIQRLDFQFPLDPFAVVHAQPSNTSDFRLDHLPVLEYFDPHNP